MVLNKCDPASVVARVEISAKPFLPGRSIWSPRNSPSVSALGLARLPRCDVEELMHHADMALYAAKGAGRNCVRIAHPESVDKDLPDLASDKESPLLTP